MGTKPPPIDAEAFAGRLRAKRETLELTQKQVSDRAGLHLNVYRHWERGRGVPTLAHLAAVARALDNTDPLSLIEGLL